MVIKNHLLVGILLFCGVFLSCTEQGQRSVTATFKTGHIGGGGYIPNLIQDQTNPEILYARSDVGGVFKSINGGKNWEACNNGLLYSRDHPTRSLAIDPKNTQILYRSGGELRAHQALGNIYKSVDGGAVWTLLTDKIDFFGNGPTRMCGEMLAIHPDNSNIILVAGYSKGVWISKDAGKTWTCKGLEGKRITFLKFNPFAKGQILIGTMSDQELLGAGNNPKKYIEELMDFERGPKAELIVSDDLGESFHTIYETEAAGFTDAVFADNGKIILAATSKGIMRGSSDGKEFDFVSDKQLPYGTYYQTIAVSPVDGTIFTSPKFGKPACPIRFSKDDGKTWNIYAPEVKPENMTEFPKHLSTPGHLGSSVSAVMPDCKDTNVLYIMNWWGVTKTYDHGKNWTGHNFDGLEMTCVERVDKHPSRPDRVVISICDHGPMISDDSGEHYETMKFNRGPSRAFGLSKNNPDLIMWSAGRVQHNTGTPVYRSMDDGKSGEVVFKKQAQSFVSSIMEDEKVAGRFWLLNEGKVNDSTEAAGVYRSDDWGKTWEIVANPYPDYINRVPYHKEFIEQDHSTIVPYQFRNGGGGNRHLTADAEKEGVIYVGEWTEGIWRTDDAGKSWTDISEGLPFGEDKENVLSCVLASPQKSGEFYAAFWRKGLFQTKDFGKTWEKIYPKDNTAFNAVSVTVDNDVIAVACTESIHSSVPCQLLISFDKGKTWTDIYDKKMGSLNFINIDLDAKKQRIYAATNGNGVYYIDYKVE
ncbi:MAG: hypothetical protein ACK5MG_02385 [Bacteroidales bacterium]